jgi:transposase
MPLTVRVDLPSRDRQVLTSWARSTSVRAELALRAQIVLMAAEGARTGEIAARTGASKPTVIAWKKRYAVEGLSGLRDRRKPGRPRRTDDAAIVLATLEPPPLRLGVRNWSSRLLASELGVSNVKVAATWREFGLQPWRHEPVRFSTDPHLDVTARDVTGLYLNPPDYAIVLCAGLESELPDCTGPIRLRPGLPQHQADERVQVGATVLAALRAATDQQATRTSYPSRRDQWFLRFLQQAAAARLGHELLVVAVDNYATRRHPDVRAWLARHPRMTPHFTPARQSWLTMAEIFFALSARPVTTRTAIDHTHLSAAVGAFIDGWDECGRPFSWTKPADDWPASRTGSGAVSFATPAELP